MFEQRPTNAVHADTVVVLGHRGEQSGHVVAVAFEDLMQGEGTVFSPPLQETSTASISGCVDNSYAFTSYLLMKCFRIPDGVVDRLVGVSGLAIALGALREVSFHPFVERAQIGGWVTERVAPRKWSKY